MKEAIKIRKCFKNLVQALLGFCYLQRRCEMESEELIRITPDKAIEILRKDGIEVNIEEAQIILDFLYIIANIVIEQYVNIRDNNSKIITTDMN